MKKFLVLYRSSATAAEQMKNMTPEMRKSGMDLWMSWFAAHGASVVDAGAPLGESTMLKDGAAPGPAFIGGYNIVQAESVEAAKALFDAHPHFHAPDGTIQLLELQPMPSM